LKNTVCGISYITNHDELSLDAFVPMAAVRFHPQHLLPGHGDAEVTGFNDAGNDLASAIQRIHALVNQFSRGFMIKDSE
jgi:hypothetical protein